MRRSLSVEEFLAVLPDQPEFDALRQEVLRSSVPDGERDWSSGAAYATLDRRVVPAALIPQILSDAENAGRRRNKRLYDGVAIALFGILEGNLESRVEVLLAAGGEDEAADRWRDAVAHYNIAVHLATGGESLELRALTLRRLGRAWLHCGEFRQAAAQYGASLAVASAAGVVAAEIASATGLGNVASLQGRWSEAADWYGQALARCGEGTERERGQLCVNLSMTSRERDALTDARAWLDRARDDWSHLTEADHSGWYNNDGLLCLAAGDVATAEQSFRRALAGAVSNFDRAMIMDNLAEVAVQQNRLEAAETHARKAEEHALALGSPRVLGEVYLRLGMLGRLRGDANAVVFFEKALELSRHRYPLLHGTILQEYGTFRKGMGDMRAANRLIGDAIGLFAELGAADHAEAARALLH